ncbi:MULTISPECIES: cell division protein FtsL [Cupriavidus]|uniref:Cell division protein FtsL n=1 Tax=Cupriavidus basilensis TaxID=68895 RepID=A0A643FT70_9BURK|nr:MULTISPECIES: cell division protein FtsL [Cupriavidus]MBB1636290.1 cell division protein FtsL [Cupriavidus sp. UME77]MCP3021576.1 cell division protein FtsL [Cupriavidus basilensis]QOT76034.1 cell division protein FtsL [Cupriavidus basilensis]
MNRLTFFLLAALMLCALSLVSAQHQARTLFVAHERAQAEEKQLDIDWSRLQYQQSSLGKSARIAEAARTQLKMTPVLPGRTQYLAGVVLDAPPASAPAAAAPEGSKP